MTDEWDDLERLAKQVEEIRQQINAIEAANTKLVEPPLAEFIIGDQYLNQQKIYPRQLTLLRTIFCDLEGLTPYDHQVLDEWGTGFVLDSADRQAPSYEPAPERACTIGTTPDLREPDAPQPGREPAVVSGAEPRDWPARWQGSRCRHQLRSRRVGAARAGQPPGVLRHGAGQEADHPRVRR